MATAEDRFEALADTVGYAGELGLVGNWTRKGDSPDGELQEIQFEVITEEGKPARRIKFDVVQGTARYWFQFDGGRPSGNGENVPIDFSESYKIAGIWGGDYTYSGDDWPEMKEFSDAKSVIDFLARQLGEPPDT